MLKLNDVNISMRDRVNQHLMADKNPVCELSFGNIFIWRYGYHIKVADYQDMLIVQMEDVFGKYFLPPCGDGDYKQAVIEIMRYCEAEGIEMRFSCADNESIQKIQDLFPHRFERQERRDLHDYIHNTENLANIAGREFHGKRNHVKKFTTRYPYEYKFLTPELVPAVLKMNEYWCSQHAFGDDLENTETCAIAAYMNNFEKLDGFGGVLLVDGQVVAFSAGTPKNPQSDVFIVHFEKALTTYEGVYSAMNNFFMSDIAKHYPYANREEDLGIEGLRKSKMSYNPDRILEKSDLVLINA